MGAVTSSRYTVMAGWDDVPHLDPKTKAELLAATQPYLREARSKGIPSLGSGAIYPVPVEDITVPPFKIPAYWRRAYGFDVGWNRTAAIWWAEDPVDLTRYAYAEYYRGQAVPLIHAAGIKSRGDWIPGAVDPASRGRSQADGTQLFTTYIGLGLKLSPAHNAVEDGIQTLWEAFETGRAKVFTTLQHFLAEYRLYRRDELGRIVKKNDHAQDAGRYGYMTFNEIAARPPVARLAVNNGAADPRAGY